MSWLVQGDLQCWNCVKLPEKVHLELVVVWNIDLIFVVDQSVINE